MNGSNLPIRVALVCQSRRLRKNVQACLSVIEGSPIQVVFSAAEITGKLLDISLHAQAVLLITEGPPSLMDRTDSSFVGLKRHAPSISIVVATRMNEGDYRIPSYIDSGASVVDISKGWDEIAKTIQRTYAGEQVVPCQTELERSKRETLGSMLQKERRL
jgi:DNA-binding NarL/FixJ family response regulator